jgi:hypothetical protein
VAASPNSWPSIDPRRGKRATVESFNRLPAGGRRNRQAGAKSDLSVTSRIVVTSRYAGEASDAPRN